MALFDSKATYFAIDDDGAVLRDLSDFIVSVSGLPGTRAVYDSTTLNKDSYTYHPGLRGARIVLELFWDDTASTGVQAVFEGLIDYATAVDFEHGPKGSTSTYPKHSGTCLVTTFDITSRVGTLVSARAEAQVTGDITIGTFT